MRLSSQVIALLFTTLSALSEVAAQSHSPSDRDHHNPTNIDNPQLSTDTSPTMPMSSLSGATGPGDCSDMQVWDLSMSMCRPLPMPGMPMTHLMVHGNGFVTAIAEQGPRGRNAWASPNVLMADLGRTLGDVQYISLNFMGTLERWTFPERGYPLLTQIGEEDAQGRPYRDAQHPHNSPVMGLTLSDTIKIGNGKDHLKLSFAPRGQSADGPVAFMHRLTGGVNPDAPLGHHIGQDVGHISSTVIGASLRVADTTFEATAFNGQEPEPSKVNLPLGKPDSVGIRVAHEFSPKTIVMSSVAYVRNPEINEPDIKSETRYSASLYNKFQFDEDWMLHNTFICGAVTHYDRASLLSSFNEEFLVTQNKNEYWGRIESLQRTSAELGINSPSNPTQGRWIGALSLGYSRPVFQSNGLEIRLGASGTKTILPSTFRATYGGNPWSGKVFLRLSGMGMWNI